MEFNLVQNENGDTKKVTMPRHAYMKLDPRSMGMGMAGGAKPAAGNEDGAKEAKEAPKGEEALSQTGDDDKEGG